MIHRAASLVSWLETGSRLPLSDLKISESVLSPQSPRLEAACYGVIDAKIISGCNNATSRARRSIARKTIPKPPIMAPAINDAFLILLGWTSADVAGVRRVVDIEAWAQLSSFTHISPR